MTPGRRTTAVVAGVIAAALLLAPEGDAQRLRPGNASEAGEFHFARMIYRDRQRNSRFGGGWWQQDWPDAEVHFRQGIERLTRLNVGDEVAIDLLSPELFDYPWLYATQTGYWDLSDAELDSLREYLLRGGFLMADDFFGENEWVPFQQTMSQLFPDRPIVEIDVGTHEVLHVLYDVDEFTQIPGLRHLGGWGGPFGSSRLGGGYGGLPEPHLRGILDDDGRLMIAINYNQDVGDAWEHADDPYYPEPMTALAYRFGVNYVVYAMTH